MNLKQAIKQLRKKYPKKMQRLVRNKLGKILMVIVALPLGTAFLFPVASAMMIPMKPSLWAKDKLREIRIRLQLH
jgi:hypothetical protein